MAQMILPTMIMIWKQNFSKAGNAGQRVRSSSAHVCLQAPPMQPVGWLNE